MPPPRHSRSYINQRNFVLAVAGILVAAIIGFFIYQLKFLRSPRLEILSPERDVTTEHSTWDVRGRADPDADLTLNGRPLYIGEAGEFSERVYLFTGTNRLEVEAKNRYGKITTVTRYVVVR